MNIYHDFTWFDHLLEARKKHNRSKGIDYPYIIACKLVENPMALCDDCLEVMRQDVYVKRFSEEEGSKQRKKLFKKDGEVTFACKMLQEPKERDLATVWEERFESDDLESCQRVLEKHQICANGYDYYRKKPGGKEAIDKYFGEDRVRRHKPAGS
ncbi:hypothetical protein J4E90_009717 [Alternaria incomplexa]|uniref:uncharacterized protein n=1 Tax=Alternaria incomplexa TaxID=1187928 RepID=UPI00221F6472|nr:uncharacterized protein J4E90_009717 [Alternaria incomplexa]KAI4907215.1 hypothetical protein J4E90_009717 [Alternaria incomplexa]